MKKYYAVKVGKVPGVYETWADCQKNTNGFSGAIYKAFTSFEEASEFIRSEKLKKELSGSDAINKYDSNRLVDIYVDGSFDIHTSTYSYGMVVIDQEKKEQFSGKGENKSLASMHNVAGELMGAVKAMEYALENKEKYSKLVIHYDYEGIEKWCTEEWKAKNEWTKKYVDKYRNVKKDIDIDFVKILAHSGHEYNDLADNLARRELGFTSEVKEVTINKDLPKIESKYNKKVLSILNESLKEKTNSVVFKLGDYFFDESKIIKFVKELYKINGGKIKNLNKIDVRIDGNTIEYSVGLKNNDTINEKIQF